MPLYYDASKNPESATLPGVKLDDLTDEEIAAFPEWLRESIAATGFWRKSKPRADHDDTPAKAEKKVST